METLAFDQLCLDAIDASDSGKYAEAESLYRQALAVRPSHPEALQMLARLLCQCGRGEEAIALLSSALASQPDNIANYINLGVVLWSLAKLDEFVDVFRRAVALRPDLPETHINLGHGFKRRGELKEATACYRRARLLMPDSPELCNDLAMALFDEGNEDECIACFEEAITRWPDRPELHVNFGTVLRETGRPDDAILRYRYALRLRPEYPEAYNNLGTVFQDTLAMSCAIGAYRSALALRPGYAAARFNLATALLRMGSFAEGWKHYESRWEAHSAPNRRPRFAQPQWEGGDLAGASILLHTEQGYGDSIQFVRYVRLLEASRARIMLVCGPSLRRLFARIEGVQVISSDEQIPPFDFHCPLLSLPRILGTSIDGIPGAVPYLSADPADVRRWHGLLPTVHPGIRRVGLVWAGSQALRQNRKRTIGLAALSPLVTLPGVQFYSIQCGEADKNVSTRFSNAILHDYTSLINDFADTAALMANLDLVITCDTASAHLAGALAIPVWVALPYAPDWRWLLDRDDSPWYPTMRLFRQKWAGDWSDPVRSIASALREIVTGQGCSA